MMTVHVARTRLPGGARGSLIIVGALVALFGVFSVFVKYSGGYCDYVGESVVSPDGTVTYWNPEGKTDVQYDIRDENGTHNGDHVYVWIIGRDGEAIERVFEAGTSEEAEAYMANQGEVFFTGSPAEAAVWARAEQEKKRSTCWHWDALVVLGGLAIAGIGVWPSSYQPDAMPAEH
jgi:hypothetical protein